MVHHDGTTHVCVYSTRTSTEHPEHMRHSSRVSSLMHFFLQEWVGSFSGLEFRSIPTFVTHVECLSFVVARSLPENGSRVTSRHELRLQTYLSAVVRKREFVICIHTLVRSHQRHVLLVNKHGASQLVYWYPDKIMPRRRDNLRVFVENTFAVFFRSFCWKRFAANGKCAPERDSGV